MAEFYMKDLVASRGLADRFEIASAATSTDEIGNEPHPGTRKKLAEAGIGCAGKHARQITRKDYDDFDLLIGMDEANINNMIRRFGGDAHGKIYKMLEFAGTDRDVADPWFTGDFDKTFEDIADGCEGLLGWLGY